MKGSSLFKGSHTEIVLSKDSKIVAKERSADSVPGVAKVEDTELESEVRHSCTGLGHAGPGWVWFDEMSCAL